MKKILLILNENHLPQQVIQAAVNIANKSNSVLEAVFLNHTDALNFGYPFPNDLYLTEKSSGGSSSAESMQLIRDMAKVFTDTCYGFGVECKIEIDKSVSLKHLIVLSRFSDIIIADPGSDSGEYSLKEILADAHCPLLLVPKNAVPVEKLFLAYDGSASSMYAIKMFSYIFPEYTNLPAQFFHIGSGNINDIPCLNEIKDWASIHFAKIKFEIIPGNIRKELVAYIKEDSEKAIVVMGAYSGSSIARLFLNSMAESVISGTNAKLFIAHE